MTKMPIRLAIVGGHRGSTFTGALQYLADKIRLTAVCDLDEGVLHQWQENFPEIRAYTDYQKLLEDQDIDAVFLATPLFIHARQAIEAMKAGKHVISEVIAAHTLEDCWELVETVEQTGKVYMMGENYCYMRPNMMVKNMVEQGLFGELTHLEGAYIHDCRSLTHYSDGSLTWRGQLQRDFNGMNYPTHSLGPVAQWLAINRLDGDQLDYMSTYVSKSRSSRKYYMELFGSDHPGAGDDYWGQGDSAVTLIRTKQGVVITLRVDWVSARPHNMTHYVVEGTSGAYISPRYGGDEHLLWLENHSSGDSPASQPGQEAQWESLWNYAEQYEHPKWKRWREEAEKAGHGGGDFFVLEEFADAIIENRRPDVDVYDAVTWSSIFPLSGQSVAADGKQMKIPDFTRGKLKRK